VLRGLINDIPIWLLLIVVVGAIVGLVFLLVWLIRRLVPPVREGFDAEVSSQLLGVVAALFGLLLAFIVVIAYQNYGDTQSNVSNEADSLAAIVRDTMHSQNRTALTYVLRSACMCVPSWPTSGRGCTKARTALGQLEPLPACTARFRESPRSRHAQLRSMTTRFSN